MRGRTDTSPGWLATSGDDQERSPSEPSAMKRPIAEAMRGATETTCRLRHPAGFTDGLPFRYEIRSENPCLQSATRFVPAFQGNGEEIIATHYHCLPDTVDPRGPKGK